MRIRVEIPQRVLLSSTLSHLFREWGVRIGDQRSGRVRGVGILTTNQGPSTRPPLSVLRGTPYGRPEGEGVGGSKVSFPKSPLPPVGP